MTQPHVSIRPEVITNLFGFPITNSYLTTLILVLLFLLIAIVFKKKSDAGDKSNFVFIFRFIYQSLYNLFKSILGNKVKTFFPLLTSFFLFILISNWFGLLPGVGSILINTNIFDAGHSEKVYEAVDENEHVAEEKELLADDDHAVAADVEDDKHPASEEEEEHHESPFVPLLRASTADLNTTVALGLVSVALIQAFGIYYLGFAGYLSKFITFKNPIAFFTGVLEIISEISKVISFAFRLFGNIFAGEVLLVVVAFLVPVLASFPFLLLEIFVGFVQALVFTMLSAVFLNMAITKHH